MNKICNKCGIEKDIELFHRNKRMKDGRLNTCAKCTLIIRQASNKKYYYHKPGDGHSVEWYNKNAGKKAEHGRTYRIKHREKVNAHKASEYMLKIPGFVKHHWNYNTEYQKDIMYLTSTLHYKLHQNLVYDENGKIYITKQGEILNTKDKHINYINLIGGVK